MTIFALALFDDNRKRMNAIEQFEVNLYGDLKQFLLGKGELDDHMPECPDVEERWQSIGETYLPDGIREFQHYPTASLGWMMYIGMAIAKFWDEDWNIYGNIANLYSLLRDKRGYDHLDEYVREEVLLLRGEAFDQTEALVSECAARTHTQLRRNDFEPGTVEAMKAYVVCLRQLYLMGMSVQLHRMGYHMEKSF